jgi:hypothetical protein
MGINLREEPRKQFVYRYKQYSLIQSIVKGYEVTVNDLGSDILSLSHAPPTLSTLSTSPIFFFFRASMDCDEFIYIYMNLMCCADKNCSWGGKVIFALMSCVRVFIVFCTT